ncbi:nitroreductase family deazaflavin-dependent oxidoreductase [Kitasatospora sp. RB6PN24]|uniref:nitroreductase family deazaflavin-dependent oxidoreductase n=1 Tax=Kitasatospora humi TaxID=2893891 RepID=UPI001E3CC26B|nr:nitroreductase family deazaflavin-dependent oxidoreductase [Kitasatospora humi]MCC9311413.1 nitroreductase family deazaflavin-dependent oxidoreductase [Kitasatospora humi]
MRAPIRLYHWHLGWVLGKRFLLLTHTGRSSGRRRQVVLEIAGRDRATGAYHLASGFGPRSQWYRNILADPRVTIQIGTHRSTALARPLGPEESGRLMASYAGRHPRLARQLTALCGLSVDGTEPDYYAVGRDHIPFVAVYPTQP